MVSSLSPVSLRCARVTILFVLWAELCAAFSGCLPPAPGVEAAEPRVVGVLVPEGQDRHTGLASHAALTLQIRGEMGVDVLDLVHVVAQAPEAACEVGAAGEGCDTGTCDGGVCWDDPTTSSTRAQMDDGAAGGWPVWVAHARVETPEGVITEIAIAPRSPWPAGHRMRVTLGASARDVWGVPLRVGDGAEEDAPRWSWDFWVRGGPAPAVRWPAVGTDSLQSTDAIRVPVDLAALSIAGVRDPWATPLGMAAAWPDDTCDPGHDADWIPLRPRPEGGDVWGRSYGLEGTLEPETNYRIVARLPAPQQGMRGGGCQVAIDGVWLRGTSRALAPAPPSVTAKVPTSEDGHCVYVSFEGEGPIEVALTGAREDGRGAAITRGAAVGDGAHRVWWGVSTPPGGATVGTDMHAREVSAESSHLRATIRAWWRTPWAAAGEGWRASNPEASPAGIVITEVLANPRGPEPRQEFIEIVATEDQWFDEGGLYLAEGAWDDIRAAWAEDPGAPPGDPLPAFSLARGEIALIVPETFDAARVEDGVVLPNTPLLRVPGSLGRNGMSNAGEPMVLWDPARGVAVATYGARGMPDPPGNGHSVERRTAWRDCDTAHEWRVRTAPVATPGRLPSRGK